MADENILSEAAVETAPAPEALETANDVVEAPEPATVPEAEAAPDAAPTDDAATETEIEDDPFAEFVATGTKDKAHYENLFKTDEKLKNTPHAARGIVAELVDERDASEAFINEIGGREVANILKPVTAAVLDPNPTEATAESVFESLDSQNPKVVEAMGVVFTRRMVGELAENPQNLSPFIQMVMAREFGEEGKTFDLDRITEIVQLALAKDADGDPILDLDYYRTVFENNGGSPVFRHRLELQKRDQEIAALRNPKPAEAGQQPTVPVDTSADIVNEFTPKLEGLLTKIGYAKTDPFYSMAVNALKYELANSPEAKNIQKFAQAGQYKLADGKFTLGVNNNRTQLNARTNAFIAGLQQIQAARKAATTKTVKADTSSKTESRDTQKPFPEQPKSEQPKPPTNDSWENALERIQKAAREKASDVKASAQIANGR